MAEKISFTADQQVKVDALISDAYKRAYAKAGAGREELERLRAEKGLELKRLKDENAALRAEIDKKTRSWWRR